MKTNNLSSSILVILLFLSTSFGINAKINYGDVKTTDFYKQFTYTWVDWQGVEHTSDITEKADSPEQIIALVEKIFVDPNIPGTLTANPDDNPIPATELMYHNEDFDVTYGYNTKNVAPPYEEGLTLLLVKVTDKWTINNIFVNGTEDSDPYYAPNNVYYYEKNHCDARYTGKSDLYMFVSEAIESVQLVTSGVRIEDVENSNNNGYLFNIQENLNKFFFISKGKQREVKQISQIDYPFGWMYEEFSPTLNDGQDVQTNNVYDYITDGESYNIAHLCGSVLWQDHQFVLDKVHNASHDVNMCFYIPDNRLKYWLATDDDVQGKNVNNAPGRAYENVAQGVRTDNTYYHPLYYPKLFIYTIAMNATAKKHNNTDDETGNYYDVTVSWDVNLDDIAGKTAINQEFYIFKVVDGVVEREPFATVVGADRSYSYIETQDDESKNITYIISASPTGAENFPPIWSNESTIAIPGVNESLNLELSLDGAGSSVFDSENQINYYANPLTLDNGTIATSLKLSDINDRFLGSSTSYYACSRIVINRFRKSDPTIKTRIASINLRRFSLDASYYSKYKDKYILYGVPTYFNQQIADIDGVVGEDITKPNARNISGQGGVDGLPENVLPIGADGVIDFCSIPILDCFAESVEDNSHASDYDYEAVFIQYPTSETAGELDANGNVTDELDAVASSLRSNVVTVKILKTYSESGFNVHDEAFVEADASVSDYNLLAPLNQGVKVSITVKNNPRIKQYNVVRSDGVKVLVAQRSSDGGYTLWQRDTDGSFNIAVGKFYFDAGYGDMEVWAIDDLREYDNIDTELLENLEYVVDIECKDVKSSTNTTYKAVYGSEIIKPDYVNFELKLHWKERLNESESQSLYRLYKHGIINTNSDDFYVDQYKIWRIHPNGTPEQIYPLTESIMLSAANYWVFNNEGEAYPEAEACFLHGDPFYYDNLRPDATNMFNVKYFARAYLKKNAEQQSASIRQNSPSARISTSDSYIAEAMLDVDFAVGDNLQTGVEELSVGKFDVVPTLIDNVATIVGNAPISIFDLSGLLVKTICDNENVRIVDFSDLCSGYYLLSNGLSVKKIFKK